MNFPADEDAAEALVRWTLASGAQRLTLSVNVSDREIGPDHSRTLTDILRLSRFPSDRLELEIGEGAIISNSPKTKECLQEWKRLGGASTVRAIIALGFELRVDVLAEGVETPTQLAMLKDFNCPRAQVFLRARPMPAVQAQVVLDKTWGNFAHAAHARPEPRPALVH